MNLAHRLITPSSKLHRYILRTVCENLRVRHKPDFIVVSRRPSKNVCCETSWQTLISSSDSIEIDIEMYTLCDTRIAQSSSVVGFAARGNN